MELSETIKKILASGVTQQELATRLGITQGKVSGISQGLGTWEKHWGLFLKLLPYCVELDLIGERELLGKALHETKPVESTSKAGEAARDRRRKDHVR